jgi:2-polyprenyl-3-methyl-5-hydroxy-6-metoxy-1,4-benzoquinol methylase
MDLADELVRTGQQADLMVANNVLAHVPDINDFVAGFALLLKPQGVATFEFPHLLRMVQENQFDTAYHEHYSYLSLTVVEQIFARNGAVSQATKQRMAAGQAKKALEGFNRWLNAGGRLLLSKRAKARETRKRLHRLMSQFPNASRTRA